MLIVDVDFANIRIKPTLPNVWKSTLYFLGYFYENLILYETTCSQFHNPFEPF